MLKKEHASWCIHMTYDQCVATIHRNLYPAVFRLAKITIRFQSEAHFEKFIVCGQMRTFGLKTFDMATF